MSFRFDIIDATLRDGSNAVNFQFSAEETAGIVSGLEDAGIEWIEVGHGLGLGASERSGKVAKETDETYITTARKAAKIAKIGCFFIQEIGNKEDLDKARSWGLDFVRIGPNASMAQVEGAIPFIEYAKKLGLIVHCCVRKSYAVTPDDLACMAKVLNDAGADNMIVMDSAGNLMPYQAGEYIIAAKDKLRGACSMKIGYHAHDNLGVATAASIAAIQAGADSVDTCLKGLGRSAGNAPTEQIVACLMRMGIAKADLYKLMDIGDKWIGRKAYETLDSISLIFGMAGFHSAFYPMIKKASESFNVDPRVLVVEVCKVNKLNPDQELVDKIAQSLSK